MLSENERKILRTLKELKGANVNILEEKTGIPKSTIMSVIESLKIKDAIKVKAKKIVFIEITSEGVQRAISGLPERIIVSKVLETGGKVKVKELLALTGLSEHDLSIGLGWIRKRGWGRIVSGELIVEREPEKIIVEETLEKLFERKILRLDELNVNEKNAIKELISRNLAKSREYEEVYVEIKPKGLELLYKEKEYITAITHDVIKRKEWLKKEIKPYDVKALPPKIYPGRKHFYLEFLDEIKKILLSMGFVEAEGPIIEVELWNFDVLFQPQDHPAREIHDTFRLEYPNRGVIEKDVALKVKEVHEHGGTCGSRGWGYVWSEDVSKRLILRTQTTSVSARFLMKHKEPPVKMFTIGKVYRPDTIDAKHLPEFHQLDGIVMDKDLNFRNLLGILEAFFKELDIEKVKFRPSYFPFTEPSVEGYIYHPSVGWVECFGAGMFRPEVLDILNIKYPTAAWGIGIDRVAMIIMGINDIRNLYSQDINYLRIRRTI